MTATATKDGTVMTTTPQCGPRRGRRKVARATAVAVATAALVLMAGCGTQTAGEADPGAHRVGDPDYVFDQIKTARESGVALVSHPDSLLDSLPNHHVIAKTEKGTIETAFTDLVLTGKVVDVRPGDAVRYTSTDPSFEGNEEEGIKSVDFDDPAANDRNVVVTIKPTWSAGEKIGETIEVRMGTAGGDPHDFMAGLRGLQDDETLWLLKRSAQSRYQGEWTTVMGSALVGPVGQDGTINFPALGGDEEGFVKTLTTITAVREAAEGPERTTQMDLTQ
ncbi:hypothetical protein SAMN05421671_0594 [Pimelobacter simplex]|nr:hypothetical protein SAMN05421671_0594 [Pimelobacter simplex]